MTADPRALPRRALITGLAGMGGLALAGCSEGPPSYGDILRMGDAFTYAAFRRLAPRPRLAREYGPRDLTSIPAIGTVDPGSTSEPGYDPEQGELYERLRAQGFGDFRLSVEGHVARPRLFSLAELKALPRRTQITRHSCEEGWSAIAGWTGVPLKAVLQASGVLPTARYVTFFAYDALADGIDMWDALHPQTILAYGMNGRDLPLQHGAPLRLRVETQLGYKSIKFIRRIVVTERFNDTGKLGPIQTGWSWWAGI
jgi:DMSO/TMAO reductase YedYZ molybdopterin-dependent catalytic subunit